MATGSDGPSTAAVAVEGDGPPQVQEYKTEVEESPWSNLPVPVFRKLCTKLSADFVHTARQVCPNWLHCVEMLVGLTVKIDDSIPGNLEFVQSVKVVQARIVNWRLPLEGNPCVISDALFRFPTCLRKLTISGKMPDQWRFSHLAEFPSLSHFVVRGVALHNNDLTGYPVPDVNVNLPAEERLQAYQNHEPPILEEPITLRRLKKLEVVMNEFSYPSVLPLSVRINEPDRALEHELMLQRLYYIVLNNITFLLNNLRSPHLSAAQFYIYPKAGSLAPPKINWKNLPLQRFLETHQHTLKQLFLPDFEGKHVNLDTGDLTQFPTNLKKLQIYLTRFIGDREEAREQNTNYWQRFLMEQTRLEDVAVSFADLPSEWIEESLTSLIFSSKETIRYVDIAVQSEDSTHLNLEMFAFCNSLSVLKIAGRDNETVLRNIHKLPASLVKIYITMSLLELPTDSSFLKKFKNLEMIVVKTILVADQQQTHARTLAMIRNILKLRKLNLLMFTFDAPLNSNRELISMLSDLDEDIESPYPVFTVKYNLAYEFEEGWNEDTFDEETLDIEFVNMREPEEYLTWNTRHRNAISVDDEDHRIFIFQTLPFLLDLRGRRDANGVLIDVDIDDDDDDDDDERVHSGSGSTVNVEVDVDNNVDHLDSDDSFSDY